VRTGALAAISMGPDPMLRQIGLIYRKDKALSKAALGFIEVTLQFAAIDGTRAVARMTERGGERKPLPAEN
jgi:hypothetical protein